MNPYQPPAFYSPQPPPGGVDVATLRQIATYQRIINVAILANIVALLAIGFMPPALQLVARGFLVLVAIGSAIATVLLARVLHGIVVAILCVPLMFVPCINLLTLLVLNQGATTRIRKAGFKVGLLGGNPDDIR